MRALPRSPIGGQSTLREDRALRRFRAFALGSSIALCVMLGYAAQSVRSGTGFPIRKVSVEGDFRFIAPSDIQSLVTASLRGGFFQIDVEDIHRQLLEEPWIREATVERIWPDEIRVAIKEQIPAARWGKTALLSIDADIFAPNPPFALDRLPVLTGPVGSESEILGTYRQMKTRLSVLGLQVAAISLSERGAWSLKLRDDTLLILGRHDTHRRLERFCTVFEPLLKTEWPRIATVDLRFTNGFSITERASAEIDAQTRISG
ncbi:MAG: cell division protein FtsQ/DivIB [Gammaproteobacteria bacterium]